MEEQERFGNLSNLIVAMSFFMAAIVILALGLPLAVSFGANKERVERIEQKIDQIQVSCTQK